MGFTIREYTARRPIVEKRTIAVQGMTLSTDAIHRRKQTLRVEVRRRRVALPDKELPSQAIWRQLTALPEYERAGRVVLYIDHCSEVRTRPFLSDVWHSGKQIVVPYCQSGVLVLFRLEHVDELEPGTLGILEPKLDLRADRRRTVQLEPSDLVIVPGVAFDRQGDRLGQGAGYYDRLLRDAPPGVAIIGIAFECQLVDAIPALPHDVRMHKVVTEKAVYAE